MILSLNENEEFLSDSIKLESCILLAENELYTDLYNILETSVINESSGLVYITESIKETIIRFINKVVTSLQKSWETFVSTINKWFSADLKRLKNIGYDDDSLKPIVISNFPVYNDEKIKKIKLEEFKYADMKQYLKDDKTYIGHYYPEIAPKEGEKLKDNMLKYCIDKRLDDFNLTAQDLDNIIQYCEQYDELRKNLEEDLKKVNQSTKNIQAIIDNSTENTSNPNPEGENIENPEETSQESFFISSNDSAISLLESFFITEDEKTVGVNVQTKVEPANGAAAGSQVNNPQNAPGNKPDENKNQDMKIKQDRVTKADKNSQIVKDVQVYMSASTKVLVAKMRVLRIRYSNYNKIIKTVLKKLDTKNNRTTNNEENETNSEMKEIKTDV